MSDSDPRCECGEVMVFDGDDLWVCPSCGKWTADHGEHPERP